MTAIDYVKLPLSRDPLSTDVEWYEELAEWAVNAHGEPGKFWDKTSMFSRPLGGWQIYFSVWGRPAHLFFYSLPLAELSKVTRLDVKQQLEASPNYDLLYKVAKQRNTKGRHIQRITSRVKHKAHGRDTGGEGFIVGAKGAARRLSVIQRGEELDYVELEVCGVALHQVREEARLLFAYEQLGAGYAQCIHTALDNLLDRTCREWLGMSLDVLVKGFQGEEDTPTEAILGQVDWLLESLPDGEAESAVNHLYQEWCASPDD